MGRSVKYTTQKIDEIGQKLLQWFKEDKSRIFIHDFCIAHDLYVQRLGEWAKDHKSFAGFYKKAKEFQKSRLIKLGLSHNQKTTMAIFLLKSVCGLKEYQENPNNITINNYSAEKQDKHSIEKYMQDRKLKLQERRKKQAS